MLLMLLLALLLLLLQGSMRCRFCKAAGGCCTVRSLQQAALGGSMPHACALGQAALTAHWHLACNPAINMKFPAGTAHRYATWGGVCTVQAVKQARTEPAEFTGCYALSSVSHCWLQQTGPPPSSFCMQMAMSSAMLAAPAPIFIAVLVHYTGRCATIQHTAHPISAIFVPPSCFLTPPIPA
jgi:hypothetical protein